MRSILCKVADVRFGIKVEHEGHPNSLPFTGILLVTDRPSDQPPNGAEGHRIYVPYDVAVKRLPTLIGMGLNYDGVHRTSHDVTNKVGTILEAWAEGKAIKVKGVIWKKDFPDAERHIKGQRLGMSMELANVDIEDQHADVWHLKDFVFTGATCLWPEAAAYHKTALAASGVNVFALAVEALGIGGHNVEKTKKRIDPNVDVLASAVGTQVAKAVSETLGKFTDSLGSILNNQNTILEKRLAGITASAAKGEEEDAAQELLDLAASSAKTLTVSKEDDEAEDDDIEASAEGDDELDAAADEGDDEADDEDEDEDEADDEDMEAAEEPGELNKGAKSRGNGPVKLDAGKVKLPVMKSNKMAAKSVKAMAAATEVISTLQAAHDRQNKKIKTMEASTAKMARTIKKMEAQLDLHASRANRVTLTPEANALLQKAGYQASDLLANGRKLSVPEMDNLLTAGAPNLGPKERIAFKMIFAQAGLLDEGEINRGYGMTQ